MTGRGRPGRRLDGHFQVKGSASVSAARQDVTQAQATTHIASMVSVIEPCQPRASTTAVLVRLDDFAASIAGHLDGLGNRAQQGAMVWRAYRPVGPAAGLGGMGRSGVGVLGTDSVFSQWACSGGSAPQWVHQERTNAR